MFFIIDFGIKDNLIKARDVTSMVRVTHLVKVFFVDKLMFVMIFSRVRIMIVLTFSEKVQKKR